MDDGEGYKVVGNRPLPSQSGKEERKASYPVSGLAARRGVRKERTRESAYQCRPPLLADDVLSNEGAMTGEFETKLRNDIPRGLKTVQERDLPCADSPPMK